MGNCLCQWRPNISATKSCMKVLASRAKQNKVVQVIKTDGKVLEFSSPVLVKDVLVNFSGSGLGVKEEGVEHHLAGDYELRLGNVYHVLQKEEDGHVSCGHVKRIKVIVTKRQLERLLKKQVSVQEVLFMEKINRRFGFCDHNLMKNINHNWTPKLESIPEDCV